MLGYTARFSSESSRRIQIPSSQFFPDSKPEMLYKFWEMLMPLFTTTRYFEYFFIISYTKIKENISWKLQCGKISNQTFFKVRKDYKLIVDTGFYHLTLVLT